MALVIARCLLMEKQHLPLFLTMALLAVLEKGQSKLFVQTIRDRIIRDHHQQQNVLEGGRRALQLA